MNRLEFRKDLESLINKHSMENGSNTPDFLLADYLVTCLENFDNVVNARSNWYGNHPSFTPSAIGPATEPIP